MMIKTRYMGVNPALSSSPFFTKKQVAFIIRNIVKGYHDNAMMRDTAGA
jgi:hypothetical protein